MPKNTEKPGSEDTDVVDQAWKLTISLVTSITTIIIAVTDVLI